MARAQRLGDGESIPANGRHSQCACAGRQPPTARGHRLGDAESSLADGRRSRSACGGWRPPMARPHRLGGRGVQRSRWPQPTVRLWGDGSPQWCGLRGGGDGESSQVSGCSSWCACGGWQPPMARAHRLGGRGVQPSRWSHLTVCLREMAAPIGAGSQVGGTGSRTQPVVTAHSALVRDGSP